jgi:glycosyltransferase involved in cell wall biosynthesis
LENHVDFLGFVDERILDSLYAHAEFFIYMPFHEPFGLTLIEAMKYGVPVIGANEGGAVEIVDHEVNGLLVDPHNGSAVESAIERMASDIEGRRRMGAQAKRKTEEYYSLEKFVERFEKICLENV